MPKQKSSSSSPGEPKSKKPRTKSNHNEEDGNDNDNDKDEDEEEVFNQSEEADFTAPFENRQAEYGIIERVMVKNFICHGRLDCSLGPNVNFVVGRNGSGKSAILTAIVVGLGGKAIATSRGNSVKNFIKDGKNVAEISIKLRNQGDDAYRPRDYGPSIIVERKLRREGGTAYKLKSCSGKVISTKREELSHILDHFNIQVDNPVSIMTQETSKTFLLSKSSKDKYKFFLKATQLEQVSNDYREIVEHKKVTEERVNAQKLKLPDLEKDVLELEQKFKALTCLQDLNEKRQDLIHQSAWAQVAELEKVRDVAKVNVTKEEQRTPKFDDKISQQQANVQEAEGKHASIQQRVEGLRERLDELKPQHDKVKENKLKLKQTAKGFEKEIKGKTSHIRGLESDRDDILDRIKDEKARDMAQFEIERQTREQKISDLTEEKENREAQRQSATREIDQFANAVNAAREQSYGLKSRDSEINQVVRASRQRLENLEGSKKNRLTLYGDFIPTLLAEIDRSNARREFHQKPLGPIGTFFKLSDVRWALSVEACLKRLIYSFCCHDQHDTLALKRIMGRIMPPNAPQPAVVTARFESQRYNIRHAAVQGSEFPSFLDFVQVNNPVIFNTLLDQRGVEHILFIESSQDARTYLRSNPPQNCREAFTIEGDQIYAGAEQRFYASMQKKAKILQGDVETQIQETRRELNDNIQEMENVKQESQRLKQVIAENETLKRQAQKQRAGLEDAIGKINNQIVQLEAEGENETETNVADLEEEVRQMESQINSLNDQVERLSQKFKAAHQQLQEASKQFESVDDQIQEISNQVDPLKDDLAQASIEVQTAKQHRKHYEDKKKELMKNIAELGKKADKEEHAVQEATEKATKIYPEKLKVCRKADNIDREIVQLSKRIQKEQTRQGDPALITQQYNKAREGYENNKKQIESMKKFMKKLDGLLEMRYLAFQDMRRFIAQRTKYYFITMMSTRGYNGQLKFDHKHEDLEIKVDPEESNRRVKETNDVRNLSGGERSFSTVCLIMALWESIESPFRAMDEFDVFMDMMNRKICIELMLQFARDQAIRQFIFLTPQDMSKISPSPFLRIHRLHDPERNQTHLTHLTQESHQTGDDWVEDS